MGGQVSDRWLYFFDMIFCHLYRVRKDFLDKIQTRAVIHASSLSNWFKLQNRATGSFLQNHCLVGGRWFAFWYVAPQKRKAVLILPFQKWSVGFGVWINGLNAKLFKASDQVPLDEMYFYQVQSEFAKLNTVRDNCSDSCQTRWNVCQKRSKLSHGSEKTFTLSPLRFFLEQFIFAAGLNECRMFMKVEIHRKYFFLC